MDAPPVKMTFDGWTLDRSTGDLSRGDFSTRLQIQPLQVLLELLEHPGELVTRERLIARLWPKGVVEYDASLNTAVSKIRSALNDDPENPRYVETVPRRGYRFLVEKVEPVLDEHGARATPEPAGAPIPSPAAHKRRAAYLVLALLVVVASAVVAYFLYRDRARNVTPSVVVLPFIDTSADKRDAGLAFGITEALSNSLAQLDNVQVVSRTSAFGYEGRSVDVREIGKTLGVTHAIEGSLRREGGVIRVTVQLVSTEDGYHLNSQSLDFAPESQDDIEQALSQAVARPVRLWLSPELLERWRTRHTDAGRAIYLYARARGYADQHTPDGDDQAAALYRLAIERDPGFTLAYIGLAESLLGSISAREIRVAEVQEEVTRLLDTARRLNPEMPQLLAAQGWLAMEKGDLAEAATLLEQALRLDPGDAVSHSRLGNVYDLLGQPRDALESFTRAAELDPTDFLPQLYRCIDLQEIGRFDEAERACARTRALSRDSFWGPFVTSWLEVGRGDLPQAIRWAGEASRLAPAQAAVAYYRVDLLIMLGLGEQARDAARQIATTDDARMVLILGNLELLERGREGLREYLAKARIPASSDMHFLVELARLHHTAGDVAAARETVDRIFQLPGFQERELATAEHVRSGYSPAVICAGVLLADGERERGLALLSRLDELLDRLERNGWANHGLDSLRAETLALRGEAASAMQSLRRAVERGWRGAWRAQHEPYLASLKDRPDLRSLIEDVEARNASMRARFLRVSDWH